MPSGQIFLPRERSNKDTLRERLTMELNAFQNFIMDRKYADIQYFHGIYCKFRFDVSQQDVSVKIREVNDGSYVCP